MITVIKKEQGSQCEIEVYFTTIGKDYGERYIHVNKGEEIGYYYGKINGGYNKVVLYAPATGILVANPYQQYGQDIAGWIVEPDVPVGKLPECGYGDCEIAYDFMHIDSVEYGSVRIQVSEMREARALRKSFDLIGLKTRSGDPDNVFKGELTEDTLIVLLACLVQKEYRVGPRAQRAIQCFTVPLPSTYKLTIESASVKARFEKSFEAIAIQKDAIMEMVDKLGDAATPEDIEAVNDKLRAITIKPFTVDLMELDNALKVLKSLNPSDDGIQDMDVTGIYDMRDGSLHWKCAESPTGHCVYEDDGDHDRVCIFCGEIYDRT